MLFRKQFNVHRSQSRLLGFLQITQLGGQTQECQVVFLNLCHLAKHFQYSTQQPMIMEKLLCHYKNKIVNFYKLRRLRIHFLRSCSKGKYLQSHLFQKWFERSWPLCHCLGELMFSWKSPGDKDIPWGCWCRWLGVMGSQSLGSSLFGHRGRLFRIPTASASTVLRVSLVTRVYGWPRTAFILLRTLLVRRSHTPAMWLAVGSWKFCFLRGWQC